MASALIAKGRFSVPPRLMLVRIGAGAAAALLLVPRWGATGAALGWLASETLRAWLSSRACRAAVPPLIAAGGGAIVTTAAYSVRAPKPNQVPYASLKAAVATLTKAIAKAHGPEGVRANCVCPGATESAVLAALRARPWATATLVSPVAA